MRTVHAGPVLGLTLLLVILGSLAATVGLGVRGWLVGGTCGVATVALLLGGLARRGDTALGPANRITLVRAMLTCGVGALVASPATMPRPGAVATLLTISSVALALDAVDGWVARRTASVSVLGARFDMEVDALLILVLSVQVARSAGAWVLAIGAARYASLLARWLVPSLRGEVPPRHWCKVVAATQGVVLSWCAAGLASHARQEVVLAVSLVLLIESFGRETWWLLHCEVRVPEPRMELVGADA